MSPVCSALRGLWDVQCATAKAHEIVSNGLIDEITNNEISNEKGCNPLERAYSFGKGRNPLKEITNNEIINEIVSNCLSGHVIL